MSSMLEELWPIFLAETSEQLETLENELDRHGRRKSAPDIDALFRDFHTLKSSFSMVDLRLLVDLAHACEDVLHGLRRTSTPVDNTIKKLLLESVDWLKQRLTEASPGHYPTQSNDTLLDQLAPFRPMHDDELQVSTLDTETSPTNTTEQPTPEPLVEISSTALPAPSTPKAMSLLDEERESLTVSTLRINSAMLDDLVTHVGIIAQQEAGLSLLLEAEKIRTTDKLRQTQTQQQNQQTQVETDNLLALTQHFQQFRKQLLETEASIQTAIASIQQTVMDLRVIPLSIVFNRLPRIVRKRAAELGKSIQLVIDGGDLRIDKGMIDETTEPLVHILQNAIDHGIETAEERKALGKPPTAQISITAVEQGGLLRLDIRDDGCGIDYRRIREKAIRKGLAGIDLACEKPDYWLSFLFSREFHQVDETSAEDNDSTAKTVKEDVSGLDRVRNRLTAIGGSMEVKSEPGIGTHMIMRVPLTVAIQSIMLVQAGEQTLAVPTRNILEIVSVSPAELQTEAEQSMLILRGNALPVYQLNHLLKNDLLPLDNSAPLTVDQPTTQPDNSSSQQEILILQHDVHCIALAVDNVLQRQELFVRDIHPDLRNIPGVGGISLLGNGDVVIILDPENLFMLARQKPHLTLAASGPGDVYE